MGSSLSDPDTVWFTGHATYWNILMEMNTWQDEEQCDRNMENFLYCIEAAGGASKHGFAAIKLTALGRPQFLLQVLLQTTRS